MAKRNDSQTRFHAEQTSAAMERIAERDRCPECLRRGAIKLFKGSALFKPANYCRWPDCGYVKEIG